MSQYDFGTINPATKSGNDLANDLNLDRNAMHSMHSGPARPSYAVKGLVWIDDSVAANHEVYMYDGTTDVLLYSFNPTTGTITQSKLETTNWDAAAVYALDDLIIRNGSEYQSLISSNTSNDPELDTGTAWKPTYIATNMTLDVPTRFSTVKDAMAWLDRAVINNQSTVIINIAGGTFTWTAEQFISYPYAHRIEIEGATPVGSVSASDFSQPDTSGGSDETAWANARTAYHTGDSTTSRQSKAAAALITMETYLPTKITFTSSNGFTVDSAIKLKALRNLLIVGTTGFTGFKFMGNSYTEVSNICAYGFDQGIRQEGAYVKALAPVFCFNNTLGLTSYIGAQFEGNNQENCFMFNSSYNHWNVQSEVDLSGSVLRFSSSNGMYVAQGDVRMDTGFNEFNIGDGISVVEDGNVWIGSCSVWGNALSGVDLDLGEVSGAGSSLTGNGAHGLNGRMGHFQDTTATFQANGSWGCTVRLAFVDAETAQIRNNGSGGWRAFNGRIYRESATGNQQANSEPAVGVIGSGANIGGLVI